MILAWKMFTNLELKFWSYGHMLILKTISMMEWNIMHLALRAYSTSKSCRVGENHQDSSGYSGNQSVFQGT